MTSKKDSHLSQTKLTDKGVQKKTADQIKTHGRRVCEDCIKTGDDWVHLRMCLTCGHVGCCNDSKNQHATKHYHATKHPIAQSTEPDENWQWCYEHNAFVPGREWN
jgi:uncharacterized UBP type Zn finger protein